VSDGEYASALAAEVAMASAEVRAKVSEALSESMPEWRLAQAFVNRPEDVLSGEQEAALAKLYANRIPGNPSSFAARVAYRLDQRLADKAVDDAYERIANGDADARQRMVDGGAFIHDLPPDIPTVWGEGNAVVWAEGESLMISGPPGVGKTTLAGQVVRGRLIGGDVLGMPVVPTGSHVLYLAMDRPQQIARALHRVLADVDRATLSERLVVWQGPPLRDLAADPEALLQMARDAGADTVVVDSLKDAALGLKDDEVGAGYNRARQLCLANGVELLELHHTVKRGEGGKAPDKLADVYGSAWLTAGAGSVVSLHGEAGDPVVMWRHLKQPAEEVGPFMVAHDHAEGESSVYHQADVLALALRAPLTAQEAAQHMFETPKPTAAQVAKARRRLDGFVRKGLLVSVPGDSATRTATVWRSPDPADVFGDDEDDIL